MVQGLAPDHNQSDVNLILPSLPQQHLRHGQSIELQGTDTEVLRKQFVCLSRGNVSMSFYIELSDQPCGLPAERAGH